MIYDLLWKGIWQTECVGYAQILFGLSKMAGSACHFELEPFSNHLLRQPDKKQLERQVKVILEKE